MSTPRITSQYLDAFTGKTVRIVGKVTQLRGTTATIDSAGVVSLVLNHVRNSPVSPQDDMLTICDQQESHLTPGNAVEVIGKVNPDLTVKVLTATDFGMGFGEYRSRGIGDGIE
jgi:replication factor A3